MTHPSVPQQPARPPTPAAALPEHPGESPAPPGAPPLQTRREPGASEATRLLCAGTYLDKSFRDTVIDELYVHDERTTAPSLGFDAARVLAHALRAWRLEFGWAFAIVLLWAVAMPLTGNLVLLFLWPCIQLALVPLVRGRNPQPIWYRRLAAWMLLWNGRLSLVLGLCWLLVIAGTSLDFLGMFSGYLEWTVQPVLESVDGSEDSLRLRVWLTLAVIFGSVWIVDRQRGQFARTVSRELSRAQFAEVSSDPAEAGGDRFHRLRDLIRKEQHAPLIMYNTANPFCGAGEGSAPWSLSVELRARQGVTPEPVDNKTILASVVPLLETLRVPSPRGSSESTSAVRDRLRELTVDEVVFLPVDGMSDREEASDNLADFAGHRDAAVEEGGETRRHFLRIQVSGWSEEIVVTVFVRVHTQGGMLMLEVAPHVLRPVKRHFRYADRIAHNYWRLGAPRRALWALVHTPRAAGIALVTLWQGIGRVQRLLMGGQTVELPDGPWRSVRELGSDGDASLFQEMDVSRYLKSVQDRVATGVRQALHEAGWKTNEFEQHIVNVSQGGVFIGSAKESAFAVGHNNVVTTKKARSKGDGSGKK